jgi:hypothetical protein
MEEHHCYEHNEHQKKQLAHGEFLLTANVPFLLGINVHNREIDELAI